MSYASVTVEQSSLESNPLINLHKTLLYILKRGFTGALSFLLLLENIDTRGYSFETEAVVTTTTSYIRKQIRKMYSSSEKFYF